mmetsp:Transcript_713/g.882  ORF Transcript_713/g.882 Transcript_713/m.882 type:complete len:124 (-) Transcript_713:888-1259(-)
MSTLKFKRYENAFKNFKSSYHIERSLFCSSEYLASPNNVIFNLNLSNRRTSSSILSYVFSNCPQKHSHYLCFPPYRDPSEFPQQHLQGSMCKSEDLEFHYLKVFCSFEVQGEYQPVSPYEGHL